MASSHSNFRKLGTLVCLGMALFLFRPELAAASQEYDLKAAFLYNFGQFVEWPPQADYSSFSICILGADPFGGSLEGVLNEETVQGKSITIRRLSQPEEAQGCNLLFVSSSERDRVDEILSRLKGSPVLTVSDLRDFARRGGIINFLIVHRRIRFVINPEAAKKAGLKISSQLLKLAILLNE